MKIAVGMSGGVDSSVAALLLKQAGFDIFGVTMKIWKGGDADINSAPRRHACYSPGEEEEIQRAAEICQKLGIEHHVFDLSQEYEEIVLDYFRYEYKNGRTPNPCIVCNQRLKFGLLPMFAIDKIGADAFATGHYARVSFDEKTKRYMLMKSHDNSKDQSYFLHRLTQDQLSKVHFPLGEMYKEDVRKLAKEMDIPSWNDPESQDFYDGDYAELIGCAEEPGDIVGTDGKVLGQHQGIWNYTVGQRRGLGIAADRPLYVKSIEPEKKQVVVAYKEEVLRDSFFATEFNWVSFNSISNEEELHVKVRSSQKAYPCRAMLLRDNTIRIVLDSPQGEIAAGQSAVLYKDELVIGGGVIEYNAPE